MKNGMKTPVKLPNWMRRALLRLAGYPKLPEVNGLELAVALTGTNAFNEDLYISPERSDELGKLVQQLVISEKTYVSAGHKASKACKHPNELFYVAMMFGKHQAMSAMAARNPLMGLMNMFGGPPKPSDED